ncbi:3,4-dihydroxy-2-butanone-4-phosphate synthase [Tropheryma whipplei]|uniref:3,4-dihydroxy-2-butanone 4-phosphate synthase n=1 Tax=Tropheryma whipplei (strain Twist) TaxID=203267 RepID=Q83FM8_TROWT|nr:3,4-dihydroxy-2-butanone-4-phosphate synthase [Tropheryma whipplei]AAO44786.1 dipeptide ABC transporter substrate-binding-like protein [Tropheryma whipplei str. Twist]MCO8182497.1 3,4-dihydroxy-2-butanone-4-phosphate synthase [Tropheryma whipplei]CAD67367.1 3,4-dihydroxy-2-butanone 4-phosphate synthase [Tropheryma whipplei TW08/27]
MRHIPDALNALRAGRPVVVLDDKNRENEADVIMAAQFATQEWVAWIIRHTSGFLCVPLSNQRADKLQLPSMVAANEDRFKTAYTISVDAADAAITTGISAADRSLTIRTLAARDSSAKHLVRPGHILPLRARDGGLLERRGHTEAAIELMRQAQLEPVAVIAELVSDTGELLRGRALDEFIRKNNLVLVEISQIIEYMKMSDLKDISMNLNRDCL